MSFDFFGLRICGSEFEAGSGGVFGASAAGPNQVLVRRFEQMALKHRMCCAALLFQVPVAQRQTEMQYNQGLYNSSTPQPTALGHQLTTCGP